MDIALGSLLALVYRVLGIAATAVMTIVVARALSVDDFGRFSALIVGVGAVGSVAASYASSAGYFVSNRKRPAAEVASNTMLLSVAGGAIAAAIAIAVLLFYQGEHRPLVLLLGIALLPVISRSTLGGVYLGSNAILKYSFSVHGFGIIGAVLMIAWVVGLDRRTVNDALGVWVAAQYAAVVVLALIDWRWWGWFAAHTPDPALMWQVVRFGAFTGLAGFVSYFNYRVDMLLVIGLDGSTGAGIYATAVRVAEGLWLFSTAVAVASYAAIGSLSRAEASRVTAQGVRHTLLVVTGLAVPIVVLAPWILQLLFGADYREAEWALRILCAGTLLYAPQAVISNYYTVQMGKPWISLLLASTSLLISIGLSLILIPQIGYVGGAWATAISYGLTATVSTALYLRLSSSRHGDLWRIRRDDVMSYLRLAKRLGRKRTVEQGV
jgi:O-antigen/teichoic acid export membrane protein